MANALALDANNTVETDDEINNQYVTFKVGDEVFGFPMASVLEIIRLPDTVNVPLTPGTLVGLANLRGGVLPILDFRRVLQLDEAAYNDTTRVIVSDVGSPVGLVVDRVARVMNVEPEQIDISDQVQSSLNVEMLEGVIKGIDGEPLTQLLNVKALISREFSAILAVTTTDNSASNINALQTQLSGEDEDDTDQLVSFTVENQEYAFNLMEVEEIVRIPETISKVPRTDNHVLGLIDLRGRLLPLVSLRRLFALPDLAINEDNNRILVVSLQRPDGRKDSVGLVVDDVKEVLRIGKELQDGMPSLLSRKEDGSDVDSICRLDDGKRLVSVLCTDSLFTHPTIQAAMEAREAEEKDNMIEDENLQESDDDSDDDTAQLVVFHLCEQEYGVSIDDVQEITRVPEKLDKVPKTAEFIEGMVNLRGTVLPVLDMRSRFGMKKMEHNERQRIIVLSLDGKHTGFVVDFVAEVLRLPREQIETAPNLSEDQARIMGQVINLKEAKRMIQVLAVRELLSEQEMLAINIEEAEG